MGVAPLHDDAIEGAGNGDGVEVRLMPVGKETSSEPTDGITPIAGSTSLDFGNHTWSASFNASDLAAMDPVGLGKSYAFRMRLTTSADGSSVYGFLDHQTVDVVSPVLARARVEMGSTATARPRLTGVAMSSADAAHAVADGKANVTVEWLSASGAALSGVASSVATTASDGSWSVEVPEAVPDGSRAKVTVADTAGNASTGLNANAQPIRVTFPLTALPHTGATRRQLASHYLPFAVALAATVLALALVARVRHGQGRSM